MLNTLMEETDNRFRCLGIVSLPYSHRSHRVYFKASNCGNSAFFLGFQTSFFWFSLLQPMAVRSNWARSIKSRGRSNHTLDSIFGAEWIVSRLIAANLVLLVNLLQTIATSTAKLPYTMAWCPGICAQFAHRLNLFSPNFVLSFCHSLYQFHFVPVVSHLFIERSCRNKNIFL